MKACNDYLKKEELLYAKKERLFAEGRVTAWNLDPEDIKSEYGLKVQSDKEIAMKLILPKVLFPQLMELQDTEKLKEQYIYSGYYTNKLLEGTRHLMLKNYRTMRKHFRETANENTTVMKDVRDFVSLDAWEVDGYVRTSKHEGIEIG